MSILTHKSEHWERDLFKAGFLQICRRRDRVYRANPVLSQLLAVSIARKLSRLETQQSERGLEPKTAQPRIAP